MIKHYVLTKKRIITQKRNTGTYRRLKKNLKHRHPRSSDKINHAKKCQFKKLVIEIGNQYTRIRNLKFINNEMGEELVKNYFQYLEVIKKES